MGAAYDAMCENEGLQSTLNNRNKKIREQKKLIIELCEGIKENLKATHPLSIKSTKILSTLIKKKK